MKTITLCGRGKCCPKVTIGDNKEVSIADDYGNTAYMNESDFDDFKHRIKSGEFD